MMCGVCGSGKTTYAKKKEKEGYIRLSIDEEMWKLHGRKGMDYPDNQYEELSEKVEAALRKKMLGLIKNGKNVILDFSFWNKESRDYYRKIITNALKNHIFSFILLTGIFTPYIHMLKNFRHHLRFCICVILYIYPCFLSKSLFYRSIFFSVIFMAS